MSSSLYRCKCSVGYRPYGSNRIIAFPERQVVSASVNLNWAANPFTLSQEGSTELSQFTGALQGSTASITLSDPYMTGASWLVLFDSAAAYTASSLAAANHILLPTCGDGVDPEKCRPSRDLELDDPELRTGAQGQFAHILIKFHYDVAGVRFGLDTFFRVQGFQITHGGSYPQVQIRGVDPQTVVFNQSLSNIQMEENETLEDNLKRIVESFDSQISFCTGPDADYSKKYLMPVTFKEKGVTAEEVIKKYISSVDGSYLKMPTREFANKISVCTRANVNQGCSVFYLGKGLYEGYQVSGGIELDALNLNREFDYEMGLGYKFDSFALKEKEYFIDDTFPNKRRAKFENARTNVQAFNLQFLEYKRFSNSQTTSGYVWRSTGPRVTNEKVTGTNLYGVNPNGTEAISWLDGQVITSTKTDGSVIILTNYFIRVCERVGEDVSDNKCSNRLIYQESRNLTEISEGIEKNSKVEMNQVIGKSTEEKPEYVRFYLPTSTGGQGNWVTITPALVWAFANPIKDLTDEEKKSIGLKAAEGSPSGPQQPSRGSYAGRIGSTGSSTGPHLHAEWSDRRAISVQDIARYLTFNGRAPSQSDVTSPWGEQRGNRPHQGIDLGFPEGTVIETTGGATLGPILQTGCPRSTSTCSPSDPNCCGGGFGNHRKINTPEGSILLAHLQEGSLDGAPQGGTNPVSSGSRFGQGVQTAPAPVGVRITTEFKGVPRALRIVPGRTVLSLVTQYDEWVEQGRPSSIDPGIWIAKRFSKWFVESANYNWTRGDLRVKISGVSDWGAQVARVDVPEFEDYLKTQRFDSTRDYYGYIRSLGDLCWDLGNGKTSCEERCEEAEQLRRYFQRSLPEGGENVTGNFPPAQCRYTGTKYPADKVNAIINASRAAGINTRLGYAAAVGNALEESGPGLDSGISNLEGSGAFGVYQWLGSRRAGLENYARSRGTSPSDFATQMSWYVQELKGKDSDGPLTVRRVNAATSVDEATLAFGRLFLRPVIPGSTMIQGQAKRLSNAREIFQDLSCQDS